MAIRQKALEQRIVCHPAILDGEPIVRGTRLSVRSIVLAAGEYGTERVVEAYPQLAQADIDEALAYHEMHKGEIDRYIQRNLADD